MHGETPDPAPIVITSCSRCRRPAAGHHATPAPSAVAANCACHCLAFPEPCGQGNVHCVILISPPIGPGCTSGIGGLAGTPTPTLVRISVLGGNGPRKQAKGGGALPPGRAVSSVSVSVQHSSLSDVRGLWASVTRVETSTPREETSPSSASARASATQASVCFWPPPPSHRHRCDRWRRVGMHRYPGKAEGCRPPPTHCTGGTLDRCCRASLVFPLTRLRLQGGRTRILPPSACSGPSCCCKRASCAGGASAGGGEERGTYNTVRCWKYPQAGGTRASGQSRGLAGGENLR